MPGIAKTGVIADANAAAAAAGVRGRGATTTTTAQTIAPATITTPPPKASAAIKKNSTFTGLCEALNSYQQEQVKAGKQAVADIYEIKFAPPTMADSKVKKPGNTDFSNAPMQAQTANGSSKIQLPTASTHPVEQKPSKPEHRLFSLLTKSCVTVAISVTNNYTSPTRSLANKYQTPILPMDRWPGLKLMCRQLHWPGTTSVMILVIE